MKCERGFTLIEMLSVIVIMLVVIGISGGSYVCVTNSMNVQQGQEDMRTISTLVDSYYADRGEMPVLEPVKSVDSEVVKKSNAYIDELDFLNIKVDIQDLIDKGEVYSINPKILNNKGELTEERLKNYYIINLSESDKEKYKGLDRTILLSNVITTCTNTDLVMKKGDAVSGGTSKALEYDVPDTYIDCPNEDLCKKLDTIK